MEGLKLQTSLHLCPPSPMTQTLAVVLLYFHNWISHASVITVHYWWFVYGLILKVAHSMQMWLTVVRALWLSVLLIRVLVTIIVNQDLNKYPSFYPPPMDSSLFQSHLLIPPISGCCFSQISVDTSSSFRARHAHCSLVCLWGLLTCGEVRDPLLSWSH